MGKIQMTTCDHCGKRVDNHYEHPGWIQLTHGSTKTVEISRATGIYRGGSFQTDFLQGVSDFCSALCLVAALDKKAQERREREEKNAREREEREEREERGHTVDGKRDRRSSS